MAVARMVAAAVAAMAVGRSAHQMVVSAHARDTVGVPIGVQKLVANLHRVHGIRNPLDAVSQKEGVEKSGVPVSVVVPSTVDVTGGAQKSAGTLTHVNGTLSLPDAVSQRVAVVN